MKERIVSYKTAKLTNYKTARLAKSCGFDIKCNSFYGRVFPDTNFDNLFENQDIRFFGGDLSCYAPTQALLIDWLREKHNIFIELQVDHTTDPKYCYEIYEYKSFGDWTLVSERPDMFLTMDYHQNIEDALLESLNYLKRIQENDKEILEK